jgi:hypothetical protein
MVCKLFNKRPVEVFKGSEHITYVFSKENTANIPDPHLA